MTCKQVYAVAILALAMFWMTSLPAPAQEARATLSGTITDPSGSSIVGAQVRITNLETGIVLSAQSNEVGQYRLLFINPGAYRVSVEMPGFRTLVRESIQLTLGQAATLDVSLLVGTQSETVTVAATAPLIDSELYAADLYLNHGFNQQLVLGFGVVGGSIHRGLGCLFGVS